MSPFRGSAPLTGDWENFRFTCADGVATVTLDRPDKLNALTFEAYADLRDLLAELPHRGDTRVLVLRGEGRAFCSGGDVNEIIGETLTMDARELLEFTRMTGEVIRVDARVPDPDRRRAARHGRRRGLGHRAGRRLPRRDPGRPFRVPVHEGRDCRAPTWARRTSCRGSSALAARRSSSCWATPSARRRPSGSV